MEDAEFTWPRDKTDATDGNLGAHLAKLEEARYAAAKKKFISRSRPRSIGSRAV